jgi:membrane associated rhomboid family serine protease
LWSLCIALAWFERSVINIIIAIGVVVFYGGMIVGVLPSDPFVSFEAHAFGAIAGVVAAAILGKRNRQFRWR